MLLFQVSVLRRGNNVNVLLTTNILQHTRRVCQVLPVRLTALLTVDGFSSAGVCRRKEKK